MRSYDSLRLTLPLFLCSFSGESCETIEGNKNSSRTPLSPPRLDTFLSSLKAYISSPELLRRRNGFWLWSASTNVLNVIDTASVLF